MKHSLYILFLLCIPFISLAGNNDKTKVQLKNISGKIASDKGEEVSAVKITIKETNETFFADLSGNFKFQVKNDKPYSITIESIGYAPLEVKSTDLHLFSEIQLKEL
ncbi:MAG: carboxypeptidase-like regulatory domain-containing protein [Bacteroidia bacterium]